MGGRGWGGGGGEVLHKGEGTVRVGGSANKGQTKKRGLREPSGLFARGTRRLKGHRLPQGTEVGVNPGMFSRLLLATTQRELRLEDSVGKTGRQIATEKKSTRAGLEILALCLMIL